MAEDTGKLLSAVKLSMYWVSFKDKSGNVRNRMALKNPTGRTLLWDIGGDRNVAVPAGGQGFEEGERLKVERMENMTLTRAPKWLEEEINTKSDNSDHFVNEDPDGKKKAKENAKKNAVKVAEMADSLGAIGGIRSDT